MPPRPGSSRPVARSPPSRWTSATWAAWHSRWTRAAGPDFEYAAFKGGGQIAGGIGRLGPDVPEEVPYHWETYFKVVDTDDAVADLLRLGGTATRQPWDTPFGRMAAVTDDQGVPFMVMADPEA